MENNWRRPIADAELARVATDIARQGYGVLANSVPEQELEPARALARAAVVASGGEDSCFNGADGLVGTVLAELPRSDAFKHACRRLHELGTGEAAPEVRFHQIFRCLKGATGQAHSLRFHYDSYVLTALLPVAIPEDGPHGDLLVMPCTRPIRRLYLSNVFDNPISSRREIARRWLAGFGT